MHSRDAVVTEAELNRVSEQIIGAAVTVHRRVGPGCLESAYCPCLAVEFQKRGLDFRTKVALTLEYDGLVIPRAYELDFEVGGLVVVEVKALSVVGHRERRQVQTYLEIGGYPRGLLLNFGTLKLVDGIKRVVNNFPHGGPRRRTGASSPEDK